MKTGSAFSFYISAQKQASAGRRRPRRPGFSNEGVKNQGRRGPRRPEESCSKWL